MSRLVDDVQRLGFLVHAAKVLVESRQRQQQQSLVATLDGSQASMAVSI